MIIASVVQWHSAQTAACAESVWQNVEQRTAIIQPAGNKRRICMLYELLASLSMTIHGAAKY